MAAVAEAHALEPSENWDDDFEFGQGNGRPSTSSSRKPRTRPAHDTQRRPSSTTNSRTFSMASSTLEDWDLPDTPDTNQHPSTTAEHTENWDDDFEVETRNNSPRKPKSSTPRRPDVREESWDDELELEAKLDPEFGRRDEEDRTVTARSRRAALSRFATANPSPPPPMPFFPANNTQHPSPEPFPRSPTASVFSVPNTIHTYSSSTPLVYGRPMSGFALLPPSPPIHKERERRRLRKKSRPQPEGTMELIDMAGRYSFSDGEGPTRNGRSATPMSDVSSVHHHHVLEPTPPLPTMPSSPVMAVSGSTSTTVPATPTKGGATLLSRIGSVKKWGVRRRRGTSSTPSEVIAAESQDPHERTPRPKTSMSSFTREPSTSSSHPSTPNGTSSIADKQWFFRASSGGTPGASSSTRPGSSGRDSVGPRRSTSRSRTRERNGGDPHVGVRAVSSSRRPSATIGNNANGDWNASRTSLRLAVGLQRESVMENSPSRPSSPLPSMQGVSARQTRVSYSGRRPSITAANSGERAQVPLTPSKLVKRKSLGFVRLGFGAQSTEGKFGVSGKYPGLGVGLGRRADSDDEEEGEDYGDEQRPQRTRRKSFSRLLLDRDKSKDQDHETPTKEGSRGFMGSVRRISLVGKHKRAQSGGGFGVVPSSPGPSTGGFFNRSSVTAAGKGPVPPPPPLPYSLPPLPTSSSQLSLRLPEASGSSYSLHQHQQPLHHPNLHLTSRRIVSASSGRSEASSVFPSSTVSGGSSSVSGSHSRSTGVGLGGGVQRTPSGKVRQRSKSRTRRSEEERREPQSSATARRPSVTTKADRRSVDFVFESEVSKLGRQQVLLPPIELQPPSPPRTIGLSGGESTTATPKPKAKEQPTNTGSKITGTRSLASALTAFDLHTTSPDTLSSVVSGGSSSPLSVSALAPPPRTPQPTSPSTSSSSLFFTPTTSPYPPASPNKLTVGNTGHSPGKQSASLGRAAAGAVVGADGSSNVAKGVVVNGNGTGNGSGASGSGGNVPRRNSLGDLKIPARISQAQVGLRRDLGMVREFAMNIEQLKELQQTYQALVLDVQGIIESHLHLNLPQSPVAPPPPSTSTGFFSNLKVRTRGRSNTNPTPDEAAQVQAQREQREQRSSQHKELAAAFYTLNSKYRISWECAELLIELAGGGGSGGGASTTTTTASWGVGSSAPAAAEFLLPSPNEIMGGAGADSGVGLKKRSRERAITLAGDEAKPTPSTSTPAALSASTSSMPANSNNNNSWRASTGRHDLSHRQLVLLREMLNNAHATVDATPEDLDVEAEVEELLVPNKEWRWGDPRNSTITLPSEELGQQQQGAKRRSGRMSGIRDMLRALKKSAGAASPPPVVDVAEQEQHHHHHHQQQQRQPPVPLLSPEIFQSTTSLSTESSAGSRRHRYPNLLPRIPNARRANKSSTGPESVRSASKSRTRSPEAVYPASFSAPKPSPRRPSLASIFRNIGGSKRPVSVSVEYPAIPSSSTTAGDVEAHSATDTNGTGDSSSNTGEEEDWDRMDSASDLDAAANALQAVEGGGTVRGGGSRKLSKNRKGKSPYLLDPPHVPTTHPSIVQKRSFSGSQTSLQQGSPTSNFGAHLVRPLRLSNVDEADYPHSPVLPTTTTTTSRPSSRLSGKFASPTTSHPQSNSLRVKPPQLAASATMPILSSTSSPPSQGPSSSTTMPGIATAAVGDWKLAMTPENIKPLLENAREVHARLCDCVEELGRLKEMVAVV